MFVLIELCHFWQIFRLFLTSEVVMMDRYICLGQLLPHDDSLMWGGVWWICLTHLLPKGNTIDISACTILWMYILGVTSYMFPTCTVVLVGVLSPRFHNCMHCQQVTVTQNPSPTTLPFHPMCLINCFHYTNVSATFITVSCVMHLVTWCDVSLQSGITVGQGCTTWRCVWWC